MKKQGTKYWHKKCWDLFSKIVRSKNADWRGNVKCYTCGITKHWKQMQAGHFKHNHLDFDFDNVHPQCPRCNKFLHGNLDNYATQLVKNYGVNILDELKFKAGHEKKQTIKDYKQIYEGLQIIWDLKKTSK